MARYGLLGVPIPKEYGGAGGDNISYAITVEELSRFALDGSNLFRSHVPLCMALLAYGTEEQKQKYLVPIAKGENWGIWTH